MRKTINTIIGTVLLTGVAFAATPISVTNSTKLPEPIVVARDSCTDSCYAIYKSTLRMCIGISRNYEQSCKADAESEYDACRRHCR